MRVLMVPIVAIGLVGSGPSDEPSVPAMRAAFAASLSAQVQAALDFAAETGGPDAVETIRRAGTDRFDIRSFRKIDCVRGGRAGHVCTFAVELGVVTGELRRTVTGHFAPAAGGLSFIQDEAARDELARGERAGSAV